LRFGIDLSVAICNSFNMAQPELNMAMEVAKMNKREEDYVIEQMKKDALHKCDQFTKAFAECIKEKAITAIWSCRKQLNEANACLHQYTSADDLHKKKIEFITQKQTRKAAQITEKQP